MWYLPRFAGGYLHKYVRFVFLMICSVLSEYKHQDLSGAHHGTGRNYALLFRLLRSTRYISTEEIFTSPTPP
jgi:hypothetical protein